MEQRAHPRNVQAVIDWYKRNKTATDVAAIERLFDPPPGPASDIQLVCEALVLQGFEAGRDFQREFPDVEPGIGYLPLDEVQQRERELRIQRGDLYRG